MGYRVKNIIRLEVLVGFLLLFTACGLTVLASVNSRRASNLLDRSMRTRHALEELFGELRDAENGQRGYLLSGEPEYLQPYQMARDHLPATRAALRALLENDSIQRRLMDQLDPLIDQKMAELMDAIRLAGTGNPAAAMRASHDFATMQTIRALIRQLDANSTRWQVDRLHEAHLQQQLLLWSIVITTLLAIALAILVVRQEMQLQREEAFKKAVLKEQMQQHQATEAQLRQAQKMDALGQLTGGIAHDFNNMLAVIVGNLEIARRRLEKGIEGVDKLISNALVGATTAAQLTKALLAFSRRQALHPSIIDINACVEAMSTILTRTLGESVAIKLVLGKNLWHAYVDAAQLESAILNLAVNSRDAMNGQGQLTIETANEYLNQVYASHNEGLAPGEYVMVSIADTGQGMTQEVLDKAFEPFFTTKAAGRGTGLGLSQIHGFLTQSKGHIEIHSELDVGTTVKLFFPRVDAPLAAATPVKEGIVSALPHTVLVVEDHTDVRMFVTTAVQELGYICLQAEDADEAERILAAHPEVSILLTDVMMPGRSGVELAETVTKRYPDLRTLLTSGYARDIVEHALLDHRQIRLLAKPFTIPELAVALRATLNDEPISP